MPTLYASLYQLRQWVLTGLGTLLLLLGYVPAQAQEFYPVVARFTQLPPYPVYLADFSNPSQTNLSIQVQQNDRSIATRPFRIRIYIEGQGFQIQSTDLVQGEPPLTLSFGQVYNLPAEQVANYFKQYNLKVSAAQYARPFSEGAFRFGVEIIDFATNRPVSGVQWANPVWITINEPPVWVMPQNALTMKPALPQNIVFQWSPRHTNVSDVEYEFTITDLLVNSGFAGNVQNLFLAQPAYYKTRTRATTLVYDPTMPPLVPGRIYAYRVEAIAKRGREDVGVFRNNGFSEIQYFAYGTPLLAPSNLRLTWNETTAGQADLNWKGETNHQSFAVDIRERPRQGRWQNRLWQSRPVNPQATSLYNSLAFAQLDPTKAYEARVSATGADGQQATSTIVQLNASPILVKQAEFSIKGNVTWAFSSVDESFTQPGTLFESKNTPALRHETKQQVVDMKAAPRRFPLKDAIISLYSTGNARVSAITFASQRNTYQLIQTVSSDAQGYYEFKGETIKLLRNAKNLFLVARYKNDAFGEAQIPFSLPDKPEGTLKADDLTVIANSVRYAPKLVVPTSGTVPTNVEEVALYRLKSVIETTPYLAEEGNASPRAEVQYNNDTYVKVATFGNNMTQSRLFSNHLYNDQLVLGVREKGQENQYYPITGIGAVAAGYTMLVEDQFRYVPAPRRIRGVVGRGTIQNPVAYVAMTVFGKSFRTDKNGIYEATIPADLPVGQPINLFAVDPLNNDFYLEKPLTYAGSSLEQNLLLSTNAVQVTGLVLDNKKPIGGAVVTLGSASTKTRPNGTFSIVLDETVYSQAGHNDVRIMADGYASVTLSLSAFSRTKVTGSGAANEESWATAFGQTSSGKIAATPDDAPAETYSQLFGRIGRRCSDVFDKPAINLDFIAKKYRVLVYTVEDKRSKLGMRNLADSLGAITYLDVPITVSEQAVSSKAGEGYRASTPKTELTFAFKNPVGAKTLYTEKSVTVKLPVKPHNRDTTYTYRVRLMPARYVAGIVLDSTLFVEGLHTEADSLVKPGPNLLNRLNPIAGVKVENEGVGEAETDGKGIFRILVESGKENSFKLSRETQYTIRDAVKNGKPVKDTVRIIAYNDAQISISEADIDAHAANDTTAFSRATAGAPNRMAFKRGYLVRRERSVPVFKKVLSFNANIEKAVRNSGADAGSGGESYKISGTIELHKWAKDSKEGSKLFEVAKGKELNLTFKDIIVKVDPKDKTNAVPVLNSVNLVDTEFDALLFGYAPIKVEGNPAGEAFIRLQHVVGSPGHGKVGGSTWQFTQTKLAGFDFGKMELTKKKPDKAAKFGEFNTKDAVDDAKDKKKLDDKRAGKKEDKKEEKKDDKPKVPEKEPYMVAFATKNLEEMKDDAEYAVEFITGGSERQSTNASAAKNNSVEFDPNYARFPLGNVPQQPVATLNTVAEKTKSSGAQAVATGAGMVASLLDKVAPYINVERKEVVLKKSGVTMKGSLSLPKIPFIVSDTSKLIMDKLEIDKEFKLKMASFVKDNKKNIWEAVIGGKTASGFLLEVKSFQIVNDFKGYGIGGRISNDKDNYVDVNSLTFTVSDGRCYVATELALPNQGFRVKSIRFRPSGKKAIVLKPNLKDKSYELEASLTAEFDDSAPVTARTDSTDNFGKKLSEKEIKALADAPKSEPAKATATTATATTATSPWSKVFPFELQKFVWSTTGKWVVSAKPRPIELFDGLFKLNIRRLVFTRAGTKADGSADALKKSEVTDLLAMNDDEINKINGTSNFNQANTTIKKDSLGKDEKDKDDKRVREGVLSKETQDLRSNTSSERLTIKELSDKIIKAEPNASLAFGFAGGVELGSSDAKGMKFDSDLSMLVGNFGNGWEFSLNELAIKLDAPAIKAFGKVKFSAKPDKYGLEGAIDVETASRRFAANFKYYKLAKGIELGAGFQASVSIPMGAVTWTSLGGGFDLNTEDQKYKVFLVGSAVPTATILTPELCQYKDLRLLVEFDGNNCGAKPVIKGSGDKYVNGKRYCTVNVELDFCRTRLMAKLNCEVEVATDSKVDVNALVIADASVGIFVGANVRADVLGGVANGIFGLPIMFRTTAATAAGMPPELSGYIAKIPSYLLQSNNSTATGVFVKIDLSKEFKWSDRVSVAGLSVIEANIEAVLRGDANIGVNFLTGNFRVMGQVSFDADGRVSVVGFALNGKMGLGLLVDGGFQDDKGWNFAAQARGELQVWRDNSASMRCNDYSWQPGWYEDEECVKRRWTVIGKCVETRRVWKQYSRYNPFGREIKVKVCVSGSFGAGYQSRGQTTGWRLLK